MLSFRTVIAMQLIRVLRDAGKRGLNISELKIQCGIHNNGVSQAVQRLKQQGWVVYISNKYRLVTDPDKKSLYDLVMAIDGEIRLDCHIALKQWGGGAEYRLPEAVRVNEKLRIDFSKTLEKIRLGDLMKESPAISARRIKTKRNDIRSENKF